MMKSAHLTTRLTYRAYGEKGNSMNYKVTIKEIHKGVVDIEADSFEEAKAKVEEEYWKNPNDYLLEPEDTFFE